MALRELPLNEHGVFSRLVGARLLNNPTQLLAVAEEVISMDGECALAWTAKASACLMLGQYDDAAAAVDRAISLDPLMPRAILVRANVRAVEQRYDDAIGDAKAILAQWRASPRQTGWNILGDTWVLTAAMELARGNDRSALRAAARAKIHGDSATLNYDLAQCLHLLGQESQAIWRLECSLSLDPLNLGSWELASRIAGKFEMDLVGARCDAVLRQFKKMGIRSGQGITITTARPN